jgi:hypothetical protein
MRPRTVGLVVVVVGVLLLWAVAMAGKDVGCNCGSPVHVIVTPATYGPPGPAGGVRG